MGHPGVSFSMLKLILFTSSKLRHWTGESIRGYWIPGVLLVWVN